MTYFPLHQTTCFFIPLVAPCKPLLEIYKNKLGSLIRAAFQEHRSGLYYVFPKSQQ